jgi:aldehyde dehydrogenase (NAD+)
LANLIEKNSDEISALESTDNGKAINEAKFFDLPVTIGLLRYYAGWADKLEGKNLDLGANFFGFTR